MKDLLYVFELDGGGFYSKIWDTDKLFVVVYKCVIYYNYNNFTFSRSLGSGALSGKTLLLRIVEIIIKFILILG